MAAIQYYVYSVDTSTGTALEVKTTAAWEGPGVKVGGPFATRAKAQAWIAANPNALGSTVLQQDQADVGDWVVIPEGEAGRITQALAYTGTDFVTALVGTLKGDLAVGGDVTVKQLTSAQQVENAELAGLTLYPTKAAAQAEADAENGKSNPQQSNPLTTLLGALTSEGTWVRVAKVAIGGVLVVVGLAQLTGAGKAIEDVVK